MSEIFAAVRARIDALPFLDTHEHLVEEATRLAGAGAHRLQPCTDFALLFSHYARDDLRSAGMPDADLAQFFSPTVDPADKWHRLAPYWPAVASTGYVQAVTRSVEALFGECVWSAATAERVTEQLRQHTRPGFYRTVLASAGVSCCQVNSLEARLFCQSASPDLLQQDLSLIPLSTGLDVDLLRHDSALAVESLMDWHRVLDWTFARYGRQAVAVKSQAAYARRLEYEAVTAAEAAPLFARHLSGQPLLPAERKALEDHLMRECIARAAASGLPVKLHCGYYAGTGRMPLARVRQNAADLCPLLADFPEARFVLMHIGYPYQDEYLALAKHYANVWVDLCWAWIINPAASVRFVQEFLVSAPANKLLTFGGDYAVVEPIVGHAAIARQGLAQALSALIGDSWLSADAALALVEPLMSGNAAALFSRSGTPA
jgi:uncharacterized protein